MSKKKPWPRYDGTNRKAMTLFDVSREIHRALHLRNVAADNNYALSLAQIAAHYRLIVIVNRDKFKPVRISGHAATWPTVWNDIREVHSLVLLGGKTDHLSVLAAFQDWVAAAGVAHRIEQDQRMGATRP